jgi:drug/metabolite transporter (DMT)-like permease
VNPALPLAAAAVVGVQVGAAMVASRFAVDQTGPAMLALLRYTIGVLCLIPPVLAAGRVAIDRRDLAPIALFGIVQFAVVVALINVALAHLSAARVALLFALAPTMTMVVAALLGRERIGATKAAGVLLSFAGVALSLAEKLTAETGGSAWIGTAAVLGSALAAAVCSVLYGPYLRRYPTLPVSALAMGAAVAALVPLALAEGGVATLPDIDATGWAAIVFVGLSSGGGYVLWLWALRHASPTRATAFLSLSPLTAAVLGAALLGESVTPHLAGAILLVGAGLWLAVRGR